MIALAWTTIALVALAVWLTLTVVVLVSAAVIARGVRRDFKFHSERWHGRGWGL